LQQTLARQLPAASDVSQVITGPQGGALLQTVLGLTLGSFDLLGQLLIVLVLSMYWSADQEHFKRLWLSLLPFQARARARDVWQNIETGFGAYLRSQVIQTVLAALLLSFGYQVLGLKYPVALALIGAIGWLIPWVGVLWPSSPLWGAAISALLVLRRLRSKCWRFWSSSSSRACSSANVRSLLVVIVLLVLADEWSDLFGRAAAARHSDHRGGLARDGFSLVAPAGPRSFPPPAQCARRLRPSSAVAAARIGAG
jgi:hypothetical protein